MKKLTLNKPERMLFALLRGAIHQRDTEQDSFQQATDADWEECYHLAQQQGLLAIAWDGLLRLPVTLHPYLDLKLNWGLNVEGYEKKYVHYCRTIQELSDFYAAHGIATVQLKGVGFSAYYPVPAHREGGDLDIYTYSAAPEKLTDKEANHRADTLMQEKGIEVDMDYPKHSHFFFKGVPIENHKYFLAKERYCSGDEMDELLHRQLNPQLTELLGGECRILTPSAEFNTIFIAYHAAQHYGGGLALHHLCDWAMILLHHGLHFPPEVTDPGFLRMTAALTELCNELLGTSVVVASSNGLAAEVWQEIMHPKYSSKVPKLSKAGVFMYKLRRLFYLQRLRSKAMKTKTGLWQRLCHSAWVHLRRPSTIFKR